MDITIINLPGAPERWQGVCERFSALGLRPHRHEALDGRALPDEMLERWYDPALNRRQYHRPLRPGEIGCYASHLALWRALLASGAPRLAVFEDDVEVSPELPRVLGAIRRLPAGWDMVKLAGRAHEKAAGHGPLLRDHALIAYARVPSLTSGYVISREGARKLLAHRPPFGRPIDVDLRHWWECDLTVLGVQPYPVHDAPIAEHSTIEGRAVRPDLRMRAHKLALQLAYTWRNAQALREQRQRDGRVDVPRPVPRL